MKNLFILGAFVAGVVLWTTRDRLTAMGREIVGMEFHTPRMAHTYDSDRMMLTNEVWTSVIAPGKAIEIKGINGDVRAEATDGEAVEVRIRKRARRSDPNLVEIEIVEHDGGATLCVIYPSRRGARENYCAPGSGGRQNSRNNDVNVDFTVLVPEGVVFIGRTVNGEIDAIDLRGDAMAYTVNGDISLSTSGYGEANTVNGSISATIGRVVDGLNFETVNGTITLNLPDDASADLQGSTVSGSITSDFPVSIMGRFGPKHMSGTIGDGGPDINLKTVNGSIRLVRRE